MGSLMKTYEQFSREELIELLHKQDKELARKKYGLVWDSEKEPEQVVIDCAKKLPILKNISKNDIKTNDDDFNIMIEGDNYHALQVLNYTHKGKIDVIYIDPPYNTGKAKEWKYNDRYVDANDGYRHSKWLNFMEKRLDLAKELLSETGVLIVHIDEHEYANLRLLCVKLFDESNIDDLIWQKTDARYDRNTNAKIINRLKSVHENIVICYKNKEKTFFNKIKKLPEWKNEQSNPDKDPRGKYKQGIISFAEGHEKEDKSSPFYYSIKTPSGKIYTRQFFFSKEDFKRYEEDNRIYYPCNGDGVPALKIFENEEQAYKCETILRGFGTSSSAKDEIEEIFGNREQFDTPKPIKLAKELIRMTASKQATILDFFAGSGTTGHAVMELNKEDKGKRCFIVCTNNEGNIALETCYPRLKKAIMGYKKYGNEEHIDGLGGNLKYFTTDFVTNSKNRTQTKINLSKRCAEMLCVKTGIFNLINNQSTSFKIYENNRRNEFLCVYFDVFGEEEISTFIKAIKNLNGKKNIFVFSLDNTVDESLFEGIKDVVIEPIPQKILDVYKSISKQHIKGIKND